MTRSSRTRLLLVVCAFACAQCSGATGPQGANGRDGRQGVDGPRGATGPQGPAGPPGKDAPAAGSGMIVSAVSASSSAAGAIAMPPSAADYRPLFWVSCVAALDLIAPSSNGGIQPGQDGGKETGLSYNVTLYTNHDVQVDCMSAAGSDSGSGGGFYPGVTMGAETGVCLASTDLPPFPPPPGNVGFWDFQIGKGIGPSATYMDADPGHPLNGFTHTFDDSECKAWVLGEDLEWTEVTLAAAFTN
jgi:hypothetical protein